MQSTLLETFLKVVHIFVCAVLMFVVLLQQGRGGGMGAAFGGGGAAQVFGGRGAGNILTRATTICAAVFMLTSVSLAYLSSSGDRAIKVRAAEEAKRKQGDKGTPRAPEKSENDKLLDKANDKPTDTNMMDTPPANTAGSVPAPGPTAPTPTTPAGDKPPPANAASPATVPGMATGKPNNTQGLAESNAGAKKPATPATTATPPPAPTTTTTTPTP